MKVESANPKLLTAPQRNALALLLQGPLIRTSMGWRTSDGKTAALVTISHLRLRGLAKNGKAGRCYITEKGRATVRRMV